MDILELTEWVENAMDREELERLLAALRAGWKRACPGETLHILMLPEKDARIQAWLFREIHGVVNEYLAKQESNP